MQPHFSWWFWHRHSIPAPQVAIKRCIQWMPGEGLLSFPNKSKRSGTYPYFVQFQGAWPTFKVPQRFPFLVRHLRRFWISIPGLSESGIHFGFIYSVEGGIYNHQTIYLSCITLLGILAMILFMMVACVLPCEYPLDEDGGQDVKWRWWMLTWQDATIINWIGINVGYLRRH